MTLSASQATAERRDRAFCLGGDHDPVFGPNRRCSLDLGRNPAGAQSRPVRDTVAGLRVNLAALAPIVQRKERGPFLKPAKRLNS